MRKPRDMSIRAYANRVVEINSQLGSFPPFAADQSLSDEDLIEIFEFAIPKSWQKQMIKHNFDPQASTIAEFIQFCERMESTEDIDEAPIPRKQKQATSEKRSTTSPKGKRQVEEPRNENGKKYCMLHGKGNHSTDECLTMKNQAKRMKGAYNSVSTEGKKKFKQREELHNLVMKSVEKALSSKQGKAAKKALEEYHFDDAEPSKDKAETSSSSSGEEEDFDMDDFSLGEESK